MTIFQNFFNFFFKERPLQPMWLSYRKISSRSSALASRHRTFSHIFFFFVHIFSLLPFKLTTKKVRHQLSIQCPTASVTSTRERKRVRLWWGGAAPHAVSTRTSTTAETRAQLPRGYTATAPAGGRWAGTRRRIWGQKVQDTQNITIKS